MIRSQGAYDASAYKTAATTAIVQGLGSAAQSVGAYAAMSGETKDTKTKGSDIALLMNW